MEDYEKKIKIKDDRKNKKQQQPYTTQYNTMQKLWHASGQPIVNWI